MQRLITTLLLATILLGIVPASSAAAADDVRTVLVNALRKTSKVASYRMELRLTASGVLSELGAANASVRLTLVDIRGATSAGNTQMSIGGFFANMLGAPQSGIEMLQVGGVSYVKGPIPALGAPQNRWYRSAKGQNLLGEGQPATNPTVTLKELERADLTWMKKLGTIQADGQSCTRYGTTDIATIRREVQGFSGGAPEGIDLAGAKKGEMAFVICPDGMLHKFGFLIEGIDPKNPKSPFLVDASLRMFDFGSKIQITAPAGALPLEKAGVPQPVAPDAAKQISATPGVKVINGGNIRSTPSTSGAVLGQLRATDPVELLARTSDGSWLRVSAPAATGWVSATLLSVPKDVAAALPKAGQQAAPTTPAPGAELTASVFNGGNVRAAPTLKGQVLDQINAGETVVLLARNSAGSWYRITNIRGVSGWVSGTLLTIDATLAKNVPVE
jgi:SH3-like domain-containing protein